MRRNNKQVTTYFILFSLLLIGVVYAILQANLQINGTAKIKSNTWDIHFDNIQVNENSVSIGTGDSQATIDPENNCKVDFGVTLSIPGDFYEFTIDVVNAGTIDGMIGTLNKTLKVNNEVVEETPDYLDYSVTYSDGVEIEENHKLEAGTTETYLVRLEFKTDIEELPQATTITTSLEPQYVQADSGAVKPLHIHKLYDVFKEEYESNSGLVLEYSGEHKDSFTVPGTEKIYYWYSERNDNTAQDFIIQKINVKFAGFCWKMFRTTDTGGVKLIFNGSPKNGKCNTVTNQTRIGVSSFNSNNDSLAYVGYMYNQDSIIQYKGSTGADEGSLFGADVSYNEQNHQYSLVNSTTTYDNYHHYTCNDTIGICETVRYYYYREYYTELNDGRNITQALYDMLSAPNVNQQNSSIKRYIENWYQNNMTLYTNQLEDFIYCNNRSISNYGGWNPNGGNKNKSLEFGGYYSNGDLSCQNITDQFSVNNPSAPLTYPVGLMSSQEAYLVSNSRVLYTGEGYWLGTPSHVSGSWVSEKYYFENDISTYPVNSSFGVHPVISLKKDAKYRYGNGSTDNPYIVE